MKELLVLGIDPSSKKLAVVYSVLGKENEVKFKTKKLPQEKPEACSIAYEWLKGFIEDIRGEIPTKDIYVFI